MRAPIDRLGRKLLIPVCRLVGVFGDWIGCARNLTPRWPPLFVVGAPRSGTTAVYLHIVNQYSVSYLPNITDRFPYCPLSASRLARLLATPYEPTYRSRYGIVEGTLAPGDGWEVFHRWFPRYGSGEPDSAGRRELPALVARFERWGKGPFVNKNNNHGGRIRDLAEWCPESVFLHVHRDLAPTAASLLEARRAHGVELNEPWSAQPRSYVGRRFDDEVEQVVFTILQTRREIRRALEHLAPDRWREIEYEAVCRNPGDLEAWLEERDHEGVPVYRRRDDAPPAELKPSRRSVSSEFRAEVRERARRWREEHDG